MKLTAMLTSRLQNLVQMTESFNACLEISIQACSVSLQSTQCLSLPLWLQQNTAVMLGVAHPHTLLVTCCTAQHLVLVV